MSFCSVLVAVDLLGNSCEPVIERALTIVPSSRALHLLYVVDNSLPGSPVGVPTNDDHSAQLESLAQNLLAQLCDKYGIPDFSVVHGKPATAIHSVAESREADLVIVGSHRKEGWRTLLGSTATAVLHGTQRNLCAVLAENPGDQQPSHHYRRILAAINESDDTKAVVNEAVRFANLHCAQLSLVSVVRSSAMWSTGFGNEELERTNAELLDYAYENAKASMQAIAQGHGLAQEDCYLRVGDPVTEINDLAATLDSQLIVLGTHGVQGLHVVLGSAAHELVRAQNRDVLAVRLNTPCTGLDARPAKMGRAATPEGLRDREHVSMR